MPMGFFVIFKARKEKEKGMDRLQIIDCSPFSIYIE